MIMYKVVGLVLLSLCVIVAQVVAFKAPGGDVLQPITGAAGAEASLEQLIGSAKQLVQSSKDDAAKYASKSKALCSVEIDASKEWSKQGAALAKASDAEDKDGIAAALAVQTKAIHALINKLYAARHALGEHVHRTNAVYQLMHASLQEEMVQNARSLEALGIAFGSWDVFKKPSIHPILEGEFDTAAPAATNTTSSQSGQQLDTSSPTHKPTSVSVSKEDKEEVDDRTDDEILDGMALLETAIEEGQRERPAHVATIDNVFGSFKKAIELWVPVNEDFEKERDVFTMFVKALDGVIAKKEAHAKELEAQLAELKASLTKKGPTIAGAFASVDEHLDIIQTSCQKNELEEEEGQRLKASIIAALNGEVGTAPTAATGPAVQQTVHEALNPLGDDGTHVVRMDKLDVPKAEAKQTSAATGATGAAAADDGDDSVLDTAENDEELLKTILDAPMPTQKKHLR